MIDWKKIGEYAHKQADMETPVKYGLSTAIGGASIAPFLYWLMTDKNNFRWRKFLGSGLIGGMTGGAIGAGVGALKEHVLDKLSEAQAGLSRTNENINARLEDLGKIGGNVNGITGDAKKLLKNINDYVTGLAKQGATPNLNSVVDTAVAEKKMEEFGKGVKKSLESSPEIQGLKNLFKKPVADVKRNEITKN